MQKYFTSFLCLILFSLSIQAQSQKAYILLAENTYVNDEALIEGDSVVLDTDVMVGDKGYVCFLTNQDSSFIELTVKGAYSFQDVLKRKIKLDPELIPYVKALRESIKDVLISKKYEHMQVTGSVVSCGMPPEIEFIEIAEGKSFVRPDHTYHLSWKLSEHAARYLSTDSSFTLEFTDFFYEPYITKQVRGYSIELNLGEMKNIEMNILNVLVYSNKNKDVRSSDKFYIENTKAFPSGLTNIEMLVTEQNSIIFYRLLAIFAFAKEKYSLDAFQYIDRFPVKSYTTFDKVLKKYL